MDAANRRNLVKEILLPVAVALLCIAALKYILADSYLEWMLPLLMVYRALGPRDVSRNARFGAALSAIVWVWSAKTGSGYLAFVAAALGIASFSAGKQKRDSAASA